MWGSFEPKFGKQKHVFPVPSCFVPCFIPFLLATTTLFKNLPMPPYPYLSWQCTAGKAFDEDILQGSPMRHGAFANRNSFSKASESRSQNRPREPQIFIRRPWCQQKRLVIFTRSTVFHYVSSNVIKWKIHL